MFEWAMVGVGLILTVGTGIFVAKPPTAALIALPKLAQTS